MTKDELLAEFDALKEKVFDFADKTVSDAPTDVLAHQAANGVAVPGGNPGVTRHQGEEATVGQVHHWIDEAKRVVTGVDGNPRMPGLHGPQTSAPAEAPAA